MDKKESIESNESKCQPNMRNALAALSLITEIGVMIIYQKKPFV